VWIALVSSSGGGGTSDLIPLYYVLICIATILGIIGGGYRLYVRQKQRWTDEGESRAKQASAIRDNNRKLDENTLALGELTHKMDDFISSVRSELNGLSQRVSWLERTARKTGSGPGPGHGPGGP
jgi:hypothetical protein